MSWDNKVVWSEGLFLRPQHLQQSDRYVEKLVRSRTAGLRGYGWGLTHLRLNREKRLPFIRRTAKSLTYRIQHAAKTLIRDKRGKHACRPD